MEINIARTILEEKKSFLKHEFFTMSFNGASQHNRWIYKENVKDGEKKKFRDELEKELNKIISEKYHISIPEGKDEKHIENIKNLIKFSQKYEGILKDGRLRFGAAQKLLNLYLKYFWCFGEIEIPPHCPFDGKILRKNLKINTSWTKSNDEKEYKEWVEKARKKAGEEDKKGDNGKASIAEWELKLFNEER